MKIIRLVPGAKILEQVKHELDECRVALADAYCLLSNQTGDLAHVVAVFHVKDEGKRRSTPKALIIVRSQHHDASAAMLTDLESCKFSDKVTVILVGPMDKDRSIEVYNAIVATNRTDEPIANPPSQATKDSSQMVRKIESTIPIRESWRRLLFTPEGEATEVCSQISNYCKVKVLDSGTPLVCVWTRKSGTRTASRPTGGANPQFDSSNRGMAQICDSLSVKCRILLIGPACDKVERHLHRADVIRLGEYWNDLPFRDLSRPEQTVLFYYLLTVAHCPLVHVGMKSGQMDMLGLWGQPTVYIEDNASPTKQRSERWAGGRLSGAYVTKLPKKMGQAIRQVGARTGLDEAQWKKAEQAKAAIAERERAVLEKEGFSPDEDPRGFETADLERIDALVCSAMASLKLKMSQDLIDRRLLSEEPVDRSQGT
jgi:hypothetical protein